MTEAPPKCTHRYRESQERSGRVSHYKCNRLAECTICGHCAFDCPGHTGPTESEMPNVESKPHEPFHSRYMHRFPGAIHATDGRVFKPELNDVRRIGHVQLEK